MRADPISCEKRRVRLCAETADLCVQVGDLGAQRLVAAGQVPQSTLRVGAGGLACAGSEPGADLDPSSEIYVS